VDDAGEVHTTFTVRRHINTHNFGDVDCATDPNGCNLGWGGASDLQLERGNVPLGFAPDPVPPATGLPATGAPSLRMGLFGAGVCLLGGLVLALARRRARPVIEWHSEVDTLA
jgi:hypothetical protein